MEEVDEEDANKLRQWCEVRGLRDDIEKFPKDGKPSDLGGLFDELGDLLCDMGDEIGAERAFREGTRRAPAYAPCYASLASALSIRNDLAGAETVLRKGIANSTKGGAISEINFFSEINVLYNDLGALLDDKGDKRGAEMVYREVIENFPKDGDLTDLGKLFVRLGDVLEDMDDAIGAEKVFREGTRRAPAYANCYVSLASALRDRNDLAGAERVLRKGIANSTEGGAISELYSDLGAKLEGKGDKRGVELVYRAAFQVIPNFASEYAEWVEDEDDSYDKRPLEEKYPSLRKLVASLSTRS